MNELSKNLKSQLKSLGMTQKELADKAGISQVMVHKLMSGKSCSTARIIDIAKALRCQPDWLLYGKDAPEPKVSSKIIGHIDVWNNGDPLREDEVEIPFYPNVEASAGHGVTDLHKGNSLDTFISPRGLRFSKSTLGKCGVNPKDAVCVKVTGYSMVPILPNNSTVGIDTASKSIEEGKMYAIELDGMLRIKLLYPLPKNGLRLRSFNSDEYPDEYHNSDELDRLNVVGRVFWYSVLL